MRSTFRRIWGRWFHASGDIPSTSVRSAGLSWTFPASKIDAAGQKINSSRFYTTELASNGSVFPTGSTEFLIALTNGKVATKTFRVPDPASVESTLTYVYNEDYNGTKSASYGRILKRPTVTSFAVVATDGSQHKGSKMVYDCRSITARIPF